MNLMAGRVVREVDLGTSYTLFIRLDEPGAAAQGDYDLELEVPRLVYEILEIARDRRWQLSMHRGAHPRPARGMTARRRPGSSRCTASRRARRPGRADVPELSGEPGRGARGDRPQRRGQVHAAPRYGSARDAGRGERALPGRR